MRKIVLFQRISYVCEQISKRNEISGNGFEVEIG